MVVAASALTTSDRTLYSPVSMPRTDDEMVTERLRLHSWTEEDRANAERLLTDAAVRRFLGGPVGPEVVARRRLAPMGESWGSFCVSDRIAGDAIGEVYVSRQRDELELAYEFFPSAWGQGFATEACNALLEWSWSSLPDSSVIAVTQAANAASRRVPQRLGFSEERTFTEWGAEQVQARLHRPIF